MAFKFNPFTGNFDLTGSGGGGGASYIDGEVQNFSALPETLGTPAVDSAFLVREPEGTWLLNRKPAGIYIRTANTGARADDWTYAGVFPDVFNDANFLLYDNGDSTKNLQFQLSGITTGTTRTLTAPDASGTIALTSDITGGDTVSIEASAADVLSVTSGAISADDAGADRIVFWDDSADKLTYLEAGSGLSISGTTITATASGGSKTYAVFTSLDNQPPSTAFSTLDTRNSIAVLDFDDATDESAVFVGIIPEGASLGSGLKIRLHWMATTATSGNVVWDVALERMTTDLDSDSFDTIASGTAAANGTSGILTVTEITLTTIDSVTAGDGYRLKVTRDANNGSDTMTGDAELVVCEVRSAA
jgi:hypothetical protein